jgi:hypothetical protein
MSTNEPNDLQNVTDAGWTITVTVDAFADGEKLESHFVSSGPLGDPRVIDGKAIEDSFGGSLASVISHVDWVTQHEALREACRKCVISDIRRADEFLSLAIERWYRVCDEWLLGTEEDAEARHDAYISALQYALEAAQGDKEKELAEYDEQ